MADATIFDAFARRPEFAGFGYIGGRRGALDAAKSGEWPASVADDVKKADAAILDEAKSRGWSDDDLFEWANSKDGRLFADTAFGQEDIPSAVARHLA